MSDRSQPRVRLNHAWQPYTNAVAGWRMLGTVQIGAVTGALARAEDNSYAQINAGNVRVLDRASVKAAILSARAASGVAPASVPAGRSAGVPTDDEPTRD